MEKTLKQTDPELFDILMQLMEYAKRNKLETFLVDVDTDPEGEGAYFGVITTRKLGASQSNQLPMLVW